VGRYLRASGLIVFCLFALHAGEASSGAVPAQRFQTGFLDSPTFTGPSAAIGFQRAAEAGATIERLAFNWSAVAPTRPANPSDPTDQS
jgi:hypothetical protein